MRKIKSKEDTKKSQRIIQIVVGIILISVMVTSIAGFAFFGGGYGKSSNYGGGSSGNNNQRISYNGFEFVRNNQGFWLTQAKNQVVVTTFTPQETEDINLNFDVNVNQFANKPLYLIADSDFATNEIRTNFRGFTLRIQSEKVCLEGGPCEDDNYVIKDCTSNIFVIDGNETYTSEEIHVYKEGNCIFIEASEANQIRIIDRIIFKLLEIQ